MYIDAHTHLDYFKENIDKAIEDINKNKIITLANSMDIDSYLLNEEYGKRSEYIIPCFGIHPWSAGSFSGELEELIPYIEESKVIGEIGLDYVWVEDKSTFPKQREIFKFILKESIKRKKIVCLHTKGAEEEIYNILKEHSYNKVIIHWYSGNLDVLDKFIKLGCYFTISVDIGYSKVTEEVLKRIPLDKLLSETDGPTALEWVNGVYGYPSEVKRVVNDISKLLKRDDIKSIIMENWRKLMDNDY